MNQRHWLNIAEYMAITASVAGTVATMITQQVMLTTTPLTLALILNVINRQRQLIQVRQLPEHNKLIDIYDDLITVNEDYRFHKLEVQGKLDTFEKNQTILQSLLEEIKAAWDNEIKLIYGKLSVLENNQSDVKNTELHQLYFSLSQRIDTLTDVVNSESVAYQHKQGEIKKKIDNFNHNQALLKSLLEQIQETWNNELKLIYQKLSVLENDQSNDKISELNKLYVLLTERLTRLEKLIQATKESSNNHQEKVASVRQPYPSVSSEYSREEVYPSRKKQERQDTQNFQTPQPKDSVNFEGFKNIGDDFKNISDGFEELKNIGQLFPTLNLNSPFQTVSSSHKLSELDLALLKDIAIYFEKMPEKIRHYHQDHGASSGEAEIMAKYYLQRSEQAKAVRTQQDLKDYIQSVEELKQIVSRYNHESYKYRWSTGLEKQVLDKLNRIKL